METSQLSKFQAILLNGSSFGDVTVFVLAPALAISTQWNVKNWVLSNGAFAAFATLRFCCRANGSPPGSQAPNTLKEQPL
jgi:hypothetical protein